MYFSCSDMELLRLAGWCKNLPAELSGMFTSQESGRPVFDRQSIKFLIQLGLVNVTRDGQSIRLREKGWRLLRYLGCQYHKDTKYKSALNERRIEIARILLTFWRAGFQVYGDALEDLGAPQVFVPSMAVRRTSTSDIWGGAVFRGLGRVGPTVCACYHVQEEQRINYQGERFMLDKIALRFTTQEAMFFAGPEYIRLARAFRNNTIAKPEEKTGDLTLPQLREAASHPLHLLECGDVGALQLRIMSEADYRYRLAAAIFRTTDRTSQVFSPPIGVTDADGILPKLGPWVMAVDMDIHLIDRAYRQAMAAGYEKLLILCLEGQVSALRLLYGKEHVQLLAVSAQNLLDAFGALPLHEPAAEVYVNPKGGLLNAAHLPVD